MSFTLLADENIPAVEHYIGSAGSVRRVPGRTLHREQLSGVDALLVRSVTPVDEALLAGSSVRFVGSATSGVDHIDREYLSRQGIAFAYCPGSNANSVVEYVLSAVAAVGQKLEQLLAGATVGIVGYGVIGKAVAARLDALGINFCIFDPWLDQATIPHASGLKEVLECEVVSLHAELTDEQPWPSVHLLAAAELDCLRAGSLLINASRGAVVDNTALLTRLQSGGEFSVVLDVWEGEPEINPALLERVELGSAHIAGYSLDGKLLATRMLCEALAQSLKMPAPPVASPVQAARELVVVDALSDAGLIRYLLRSRYDISQDDALLRAAVLHANPINTFDLLRKNYRERRELAGTNVSVALQTPGQLAVLRALGCVPGSAGAIE